MIRLCSVHLFILSGSPNKASLFQAVRWWGRRESERYAKSWRGGAGRVGFHPFFFLMFALSQFSGPDYLRAWNRKNEAVYVRAVYV